jgi:hypothetical protein
MWKPLFDAQHAMFYTLKFPMFSECRPTCVLEAQPPDVTLRYSETRLSMTWAQQDPGKINSFQSYEAELGEP